MLGEEIYADCETKQQRMIRNEKKAETEIETGEANGIAAETMAVRETRSLVGLVAASI